MHSFISAVTLLNRYYILLIHQHQYYFHRFKPDIENIYSIYQYYYLPLRLLYYLCLYSDADAKLDKSPYHSGVQGLKTDPLAILAKQMGGSKRNALLKWCQNRLATYPVSDQSPRGLKLTCLYYCRSSHIR